ncbi:transposase family protein [Streptomyces coelicoflavus]|uniref:transposase family protein n=1 Tax=Streptomyces coelicoflavus TaxID=285562 RepID=UPI00350E512D
MIALLAAQAPRLDRALQTIARQGGEAVLIEGTLVHTQRRTGKADRKNYSGKHRQHGLQFLALTDERGRLIRMSAARSGRTHDNTAARHDHILAHLRAASLGALADLGFRGLDNDIHSPCDRHRLRRHPRPQAHPGPEGSQPCPRRRTCTGRARLRPPQELTDLDQASYRSRPRHPPPACTARPDESGSQPLKQHRMEFPATSPSGAALWPRTPSAALTCSNTATAVKGHGRARTGHQLRHRVPPGGTTLPQELHL